MQLNVCLKMLRVKINAILGFCWGCHIFVSFQEFHDLFIQAHHSIHMRTGIKFGDASLKDTMINDGLTDAFNDYHMGITGKIAIL